VQEFAQVSERGGAVVDFVVDVNYILYVFSIVLYWVVCPVTFWHCLPVYGGIYVLLAPSVPPPNPAVNGAAHPFSSARLSWNGLYQWHGAKPPRFERHAARPVSTAYGVGLRSCEHTHLLHIVSGFKITPNCFGGCVNRTVQFFHGFEW
jgi:hypothetical protein